jgi:hypothetical protein
MNDIIYVFNYLSIPCIPASDGHSLSTKYKENTFVYLEFDKNENIIDYPEDVADTLLEDLLQQVF